MARRSNAQTVDLIRQSLGDKSIVLVGLMGAGKTSIGRRLAGRLGLPFTDADAEIELAAGKSIPEIFADHGEAYFRDGERRVIARLLQEGPRVLATGGGAYMNEETREAIRRHGIAVWLRGDLALLMKRVRKRSNRPLLANEDPEAVMRRLIDVRYPVYALADVVVDSRDVPHDAMVKDVVAGLAKWVARAQAA